MAKQDGILRIQGTLGNLVFYKQGNDYRVRQRPAPIGKKFKTDPRYASIRANNELFIKAVKANQLLRYSLRPFLASVILGSAGKLTKVFREALNSVDRYEKRQCFSNADLTCFNDLELGDKASFKSILMATYQTGLDRNTGHYRAIFPEFDPRVCIKAPTGATHFIISVVVTALDFDGDNFETNSESSAFIPLSGEPSAAMCLSTRIPVLPNSFQFFCLAIQFATEEQDGKIYSLKGGSNAMMIVEAQKFLH
jgi:hypothetical protein